MDFYVCNQSELDVFNKWKAAYCSDSYSVGALSYSNGEFLLPKSVIADPIFGKMQADLAAHKTLKLLKVRTITQAQLESYWETLDP